MYVFRLYEHNIWKRADAFITVLLSWRFLGGGRGHSQHVIVWYGPACHFTRQMSSPKWPFPCRRWHKTLRFGAYCPSLLFSASASASSSQFQSLVSQSLSPSSFSYWRIGRYLVTLWVATLNDPPVYDFFFLSSSSIFQLTSSKSFFTYSWPDGFPACIYLTTCNFLGWFQYLN